MLTQVAAGVLVHESECIQSNAVIVEGASGVLLIDPGITNAEMLTLADDLRQHALPVVAGFSTHPHWDHVLWHAAFGDVPRYGTARAAASVLELLAMPDWEEQVAEGLPPEFADDIPMEMLGLITALAPGSDSVPWDGPAVRIIEHRGHSVGHAALVIAASGVLVAGDMLSDVLIPMLDPSADDAIGDYLHALDAIEGAVGEVGVVVPGHGAVGGADELRHRIELDRAYVRALRDGISPEDPRIGPTAQAGWEWVSDVHHWQFRRLGGRSDR